MTARMSPTVNSACWADTSYGSPCNRPTSSDVGLCDECLQTMRDTTRRRPSVTRTSRGPSWTEVAGQLWDQLWQGHQR